jgi:hypothetical protein
MLFFLVIVVPPVHSKNHYPFNSAPAPSIHI